MSQSKNLRYPAILHASLVIADIEKSRHFYCDILNMQIASDRPDLNFPGYWLNIGAQQIHMLQVPNPDPTSNRPAHCGRDRHTALQINDIETLKQVLQHNSIPYTESRSGRAAIFCRDPDGNALEFIHVPD